MGITIGIDLGTTTCEMAYIKNGKPEIIIDGNGKRITLSIVGIGVDGQIKVGETIKNQLMLKPDMTVAEVKRLMGTDKRIKMGERDYSPQEISAIILKYLKESAEEYLGEKVTEAVITVPANFDELQKSATKAAGEIAGLKVERIINEPTAAALAYGIDNLENEEKILVYDLGGGTFDVSILENFDGIMDVKTSEGDNLLGGADFDERIMEYVFEDFSKRYGMDLRSNIRARASVKDAAEKAKIALSNMEATEINIPFVGINSDGNPLGIELKITKSKFEELTRDLVERTELILNKAFNQVSEKYGYSEKDIDIILPVGGSTRIPAVKKMLKQRFGDKVKMILNPDEAIALGAAVQAGIKTGEIDGDKSILITDICSHTLGTSITSEIGGRTIDGLFDPIIMKGTTIPCSRKRTYFTLNDNQDKMDVDIYQGEARLVIENQLIGDFILEGLPEGSAGAQTIEVEINCDINGMLQVEAVIVSNGKKASISIDTKSMSQEDIYLSREKLNTDWRKSTLAKKVELIITTAEEKMDKLNPSDKSKIEMVLSRLKEALLKENEELVDQYDEELTNILFDI